MAQNKEQTKKITNQITSAPSDHPITFDAYAIFQSGGKQYQGVVGKTIALEKIVGETGDSVEFSDVLLRKASDGSVEIGQPFLKKPIKASIVKQMRGPKLIVFKFKRRKKSRVKKGHRQSLTVVRIESI
jgi:large subunit ribosomal protein L21